MKRFSNDQRRCKMRIFDVVTRLVLLAWIGILGFGCDRAGPTEAPDAPKAEGPQLLKLPSSNSLQKPVSATARITVRYGGQLTLNTSGQGPYVAATLTFPKGAVSQDVTITMTLENQTLAFDFDPDGISFNQPATLDVYARGLDLSGIPFGARLKLFYDNGRQLTPMQATSISVNPLTGELWCNNGLIPHFSRYAFGYSM
jgi:hypothetical protein